jgi:PHP family Zn ribbon phosphoesterase
MSVNNIVNMSILKGLQLIALTDHNSAKNCPAFISAAKKAGINAIAGMEINTAEEVHAVCLFPELENAMRFDAYVYENLMDIKNEPAIFGEQLMLDEHDCVVGTVEKLLINATSISFFDLAGLMHAYGGLYFPAHIDKSSLSLISNLGFVPPDIHMDAYELKDKSQREALEQSNPPLKNIPLLTNSDAHYLWDISEAENILPEHFLSLLGF